MRHPRRATPKGWKRRRRGVGSLASPAREAEGEGSPNINFGGIQRRMGSVKAWKKTKEQGEGASEGEYTAVTEDAPTTRQGQVAP